MGHTYFSCHYHIIFSTKNRINFLNNEVRPHLHTYLESVINNEFGYAHIINGTADHIHILAEINPKHSISHAIGHKGCSSKWIKGKYGVSEKFAWQNGYGAFTVSKLIVHNVEEYILNQQEHHKQLSFHEEFTAFLKKHEVRFNKSLVWSEE